MAIDDMKEKRKATQFGSGAEAVEKGKIGGIASGASRRRKTSMIQTWEIVRKMTLSPGEHDSVEEVQNVADVKGANLTVEEAIILAQANKAMRGDTRAAELLMKWTDQNKTAQAAMKATELQNKKTRLEIERLEVQLNAYKDALENAENTQVVIIDDLDDETI